MKYMRLQGPLLGRSAAFLEVYTADSSMFWGLNLKLINEVGCEDPRDLYEAGEWDWEAFLRVCRDIKQSGDDIWPLGGEAQHVFRTLLAANEGYMWDNATNTQMFDQPPFKNALTFFEKILMEDQYIRVHNNNISAVTTFDFMRGNIVMFPLLDWYVNAGDVEWPVGAVTPPRGPDASGIFSAFKRMSGLIVPKGTVDPANVYKVIEESFMWWQDDTYLANLGRIDWYNSVFASGADVRRIIDIMDTKCIIDPVMQLSNGLSDVMIREIYTNGMSAAQAIETHKLALETDYRSWFGISE